ncbi:MAG TPA: amidase [Candidatus Binatia bacterium]|nr:amidase [Candidatus Binatia bacterium]
MSVSPSDLALLDATAQAALVRDREVTPRELVDSAIDRIGRVNPRLNAVITPLFEKARAQATARDLPDGPFRGVPFLLKDLTCHSAGDPYHAGMRFLRDLHWVEKEDTHLAARFRAAGFVFLGKTNTPELGPVPTTEPLAYGRTRNPWDPSRSPGGSSGGSAAAVASGMVPAAHANDGGGSIRIPASECGLVGLKPSRGRTSLGPDVGESWAGLVVEHVVTRSVRDTAGILDAVAGYAPGDPYTATPPVRPFRQEVGASPGRLRVGLRVSPPGSEIAAHPACVAAARETARLLESLGHRVEESWPGGLDDQGAVQAAVRIITSCTARDLSYWTERTGRTIGPDDVEPMVWGIAEIGRSVSAVEYIRAAEYMQAYTRHVASWWTEGFDLLLTPTLPEPPPPLGKFDATPDDPMRGFARGGEFVAFTMPFNMTGQPAISLPLHWSDDGLPIGVQLVAAYGREDLLIRVAAQLEEARPWRERRPRVHAVV